MLRVIFILLFLLISWILPDSSILEKIIFFACSLSLFVFIEFVLLKKVPYYRILTFLVTLTLFFIVLSLSLSILGIKVNFDFENTSLLRSIILIFILQGFYIALETGANALYFKKKLVGDSEVVSYVVDTSAIIDGRIIRSL